MTVRDFLGRTRLPRRHGHHVTCHNPDCGGCETVGVWTAEEIAEIAYLADAMKRDIGPLWS